MSNSQTRRWFRRFYQHGIVKYDKWHPTKPYQVTHQYGTYTVNPRGPYWNEYNWFPIETNRVYEKRPKDFYKHFRRNDKTRQTKPNRIVV